jgi:hypothetical protein
MATEPVCKIPSCDKGGKLRRGWCKKHYWRWSKFGDPEPADIRRVRGPGECAIDGCGRVGRLTRGWCNLHYIRWLRTGDPRQDQAPNGSRVPYMLDHMWDDCPKWPFGRNRRGYAVVGGSGEVGSRLVHVRVCEIVHGPKPSSGYEAAHQCGKGNEGCFGAHCVSWKTKIENAADAVRHGTSIRGEKHHNHILTADEVRTIDRLRPKVTTGEGAAGVARGYGVSSQTIADIWLGRTWGWLTGRGDADNLHAPVGA